MRLTVSVVRADHTDLPEHEGHRYVECPAVQEEIGRFEELQPVTTWIDVQIGEQTVDRRHGRNEFRRVAFGSRSPNGLVA